MLKFRFILFGVVLGCAVFLISALRPKPDFTQKEQLIMHALFGVMEAVHFQPQHLDDDLSQRAFDLFMTSLDGSKRFLLQEEVAELEKFELDLDDQVGEMSLRFFERANMIIEKATERAEEIYVQIIQEDIDVYAAETLELDGEKKDYPMDIAGLKDEWRKVIKRQIVAKLDRMLEKQEKEEDQAKHKTLDQMIAKAQADTKDQMDDWFERMDRVRRSDRFEAYLSTFAELFDPHSGYFSPKEKQDYDIQIGGRLEGIGARLQQDDEYVKVATIVPGGPAWKGKELEVDDLIMIVTQEGEDPVELLGMRVDDAVQYIRGAKGTVVTLTVRKLDGSVKDISIERDEVIIDASFARSVILDLSDEVQDIGYIKLPVFYSTFDGGNSCAADVATEIEKLSKNNVNGIILDLRYNGGGSLPDVIEMSGLFIEKGPVVQVKSRGQDPYIHADKDKSVAYDGPLIVLVNTISASASEILAAALQDYKRAVIVGGNSTYGKATVQRFFDLDRAIRGSSDMKPLGQVKLTIQKFYRVNGGSTQLKGVVPDIILPDQFSHIEVGERESESALAWSEIEPVEFGQDVYTVTDLDKLKANSKARITQDSVFQLIDEKARLARKMEDYSLIPLGLEEFRKEMDRRDLESKKFNQIMKSDVEGLSVTTMKADQDYMALDSSRIARHEDWLKQVKRDVYLKETLMIMKDMLGEKAYVKR